MFADLLYGQMALMMLAVSSHVGGIRSVKGEVRCVLTIHPPTAECRNSSKKALDLYDTKALLDCGEGI